MTSPDVVEQAAQVIWSEYGKHPTGPLAAWLTEQDCRRFAQTLAAANLLATTQGAGDGGCLHHASPNTCGNGECAACVEGDPCPCTRTAGEGLDEVGDRWVRADVHPCAEHSCPADCPNFAPEGGS